MNELVNADLAFSNRYEAAPPAEIAAPSALSESDVAELASGLLEATDEHELDRFLGRVIRRAARAARSFIASPTARSLGDLLKRAATAALPAVGRPLGAVPAGVPGDDGSGDVAGAATKYLGLELEGLSAEDQEFEAAKQFVRFAGNAAIRAATQSAESAPSIVARAAAVQAARKHAPGLLRNLAGLRSSAGPARPAASGEWVRRGRNLIVLAADR